jgi:hypothetical protein
MPDPRLIMYHKQSTSARTRFLKLPYGGVCGFEELPAQASLADDSGDAGDLFSQPALLLRAAETRFDLPSGSLEAEPGYRCKVISEEGTTEVHLARFTTTDPPFEQASAHGAAFIDLTQARGLPAVELALLRLAYEKIMGG